MLCQSTALQECKATARELGIGDYGVIPTVRTTTVFTNHLLTCVATTQVTYDTQLIKALHLLIQHKLSAIPVVDKNGAIPAAASA